MPSTSFDQQQGTRSTVAGRRTVGSLGLGVRRSLPLSTKRLSFNDGNQQKEEPANAPVELAPVVCSATLAKRLPPTSSHKFIVQEGAYHCTHVRKLLTARGKEWTAVCRNYERISAEDISSAQMVWFKYEFIDGMPKVPRTVVPAPILHSPEVMKLFNAVVIAEEEEDCRGRTATRRLL